MIASVVVYPATVSGRLAKSIHRSCVWDKTLSTLLTTLGRDLLMQATFNVTETIQDIHVWNAVIRSKRTPNPVALTKIGRRR